MTQEFDRLIENVFIKQKENGKYTLQINGQIYIRGVATLKDIPTKGLHWEPFVTETGEWDTFDEAKDAGQKYNNDQKEKLIEQII
jgi:hypothetical protein